MKSIKFALIMVVFTVASIVALDRPIFVNKEGTIQVTDPEILQIQDTLQALGREHLAAQNNLGSTAYTAIQNKITELKNQLNNALTPEQRTQIKTKIEQLKLNIQQYVKPATAPAA